MLLPLAITGDSSNHQRPRPSERKGDLWKNSPWGKERGWSDGLGRYLENVQRCLGSRTSKQVSAPATSDSCFCLLCHCQEKQSRLGILEHWSPTLSELGLNPSSVTYEWCDIFFSLSSPEARCWNKGLNESGLLEKYSRGKLKSREMRQGKGSKKKKEKQARIEYPVLDNHMISGIVSSKVVFQVVQNSPQLVVKDWPWDDQGRSSNPRGSQLFQRRSRWQRHRCLVLRVKAQKEFMCTDMDMGSASAERWQHVLQRLL